MSTAAWADALHVAPDNDAALDPLLPLRLMAAIYTASPSPILAAGEEREVLFWNSAATRVFGYSASEAMQRRLPFLAAPEEWEAVQRVHERVFAGETVTGFELTGVTRDGEPVNVLVSAAPLRVANGRVRGMVATLEDITHRKVAERALVESERRYRRLFEQIADGIVVHRDGVILLANGICYDMLGLPRSDLLIGRSIFEFLHPDDHEQARQRVRALMRGETVSDVAEYRIRRPDSDELVIEVRSDVFSWDGQPAIQFVAHDLTHRRRQEERLRATERQMRQAQKMEAVGRLAGGIAHDFNNVLTAIGGFSSLLREEIPATSPLFDYVHEIERGVERASALTRQLLTFSKRQIAQPRLLDLNTVVRDLQPMLQRLLREDIVLQVQLSEQPAVVEADLSQMEQVILNLAVNARDAMPDGGELTLETQHVTVDEDYAAQHVRLTAGAYVMLAVTDTGAGMTSEVLEHLFEPFYTTKSNGTGLGLSTVYGIVEQSGGGIWVYSEPGRGSRFKVFLPQQQCSIEEPAPRPPVHEATRSGTVLLVEDDGAVRRLTQQILQRGGLTVLTAVDGFDALQVARTHRGLVDVVLTDVIMPEMQGPELIAALRAEQPELRAIFMSGYAEDALARRGDLAGHIPVLEKPFTAAGLLAAIDRALAPA